MTAQNSLEARLLAAHAVDDKQALVGLYQEASHAADAAGDTDAAAFYMTHAYVFALDIAHPDAAALKAWLEARNRL